MLYSFRNDYSEGCHPKVLDSFKRLNKVQFDSYGEDEFSQNAAEKIKSLIDEDADIHFLSGGTQTNLVMLSSILRPHEAVIAAKTAHISTHETGAIEATGHKIIEIPTNDGKLTPATIQSAVDEHYFEHMVYPRVVFISDTTELGTVYTKKELSELRKTCSQNDLYLYIDGARIGMALTSGVNDLNFTDLPAYADAFYIGGTKNGLLFGEALVITNDKLKPFMRYHLKQKGALLAKSAAIAVQFEAVFENNLYLKIAEHANRMAIKLSSNIESKGYRFLSQPQSNQLFPVFPETLIKTLEEDFGFYIWEKYNENKSAVRLVTSWATNEKFVDKFLNSF